MLRSLIIVNTSIYEIIVYYVQSKRIKLTFSFAPFMGKNHSSGKNQFHGIPTIHSIYIHILYYMYSCGSLCVVVCAHVLLKRWIFCPRIHGIFQIYYVISAESVIWWWLLLKSHACKKEKKRKGRGYGREDDNYLGMMRSSRQDSHHMKMDSLPEFWE